MVHLCFGRKTASEFIVFDYLLHWSSLVSVLEKAFRIEAWTVKKWDEFVNNHFGDGGVLSIGVLHLR